MSRQAAIYPQRRRTKVAVWEIFLLDRLPLVARVFVTLLIAAAAVALGLGMLAAQEHFAALRADGHVLNPFASLLAGGSIAATLWPGWAAAVCFALSLRRLVGGAPEPPMGSTEVLKSASAMRAALRREYLAVRVVLIIVAIVAALDCGRLGVYAVRSLTGDRLAGGDVGLVAVEALGYVAATVVLIVWMTAFRRDLDRWGAIDD